MTRDEMLTALGKLKYASIWPGEWEDVGFTERELWINGLGYGYIMCDEQADEEHERTWADVHWNDMDDELLSVWIDRLSNK